MENFEDFVIFILNDFYLYHGILHFKDFSIFSWYFQSYSTIVYTFFKFIKHEIVEKFIYVTAFKKGTQIIKTHITLCLSAKKCAFYTSDQIDPRYDFYFGFVFIVFF